MSKTLLQNFDKNEAFDCSAYLCHGLQWPASNYICEVNAEDGTSSDSSAECFVNQAKEEVVPLPTVCWNTVQKEKIGSSEECLDIYLNEHYYEREYNTLLQWMDDEEIIVPTPSHFADKREEIKRFSLLADEALSKGSNGWDQPLYSPSVQRTSCEDLANEVAIKVIETTPRATSSGGLQSFIEEQLEGFGPDFQKIKIQKDGVFHKRRLCRHFAKGFCVRGDLCDFLHDSSIFCSDDQKVFLGGLPLHLTPEILKFKLQQQRLTVLNKPRIMRGFTPQVCLGSVEEAEKLISQRYIFIDNHRVDIRPYQDKNQLRQEFPSVIKRSVFLGGLQEATTLEMIVNDLRRLDIKVVDCPVIKNGYAPRVVLETMEQAKMLVELKRVMVNGTVVDVRPYINFRKHY